MIMEAYSAIKRRGGRVGVINISSHIKSLLVITHLVSHLEHFNSESEAVEALSVS